MKPRKRLIIPLFVLALALFAVTHPVRSRLWRSVEELRRQREALVHQQRTSREAEDLREQLLNTLKRLADKPEDPDLLLRTSSLCGQLRLYPDAIFYAEQAAEVSPKDSEPHRALGDIHFTQGRYDIAMNVYQKAMDLNPTEIESAVRLAYLYIKLGWSTETRAVLKHLEKIGLEPARVALLQAMFAYQNADFTVANENLTRALRSNANNPEVYALMASVHKEQAKQKQAQKEIEKAIELNPQEGKYHVIHGQILLAIPEQDLIPQARKAFARALELRPQNVEALYGLAQCAKRLRNESESLKYYQQVQQIAPEHSGVLAELAQVLARTGKVSEARAMMAKYRNALENESHLKGAHIRVAMKPHDYQAHFNLGMLHLKLSDHPRAIVELRRALDLKKDDSRIRRMLADALALAGRYDESRDFAPARPLPQAMREIKAFAPA